MLLHAKIILSLSQVWQQYALLIEYNNLFQSHETMKNSDIPEVWIKKKQSILCCYEKEVGKTHFNNTASLVTVAKK